MFCGARMFYFVMPTTAKWVVLAHLCGFVKDSGWQQSFSSTEIVLLRAGCRAKKGTRQKKKKGQKQHPQATKNKEIKEINKSNKQPTEE